MTTWPPAGHDRQGELFEDDAEPCEPPEQQRDGPERVEVLVLMAGGSYRRGGDPEPADSEAGQIVRDVRVFGSEALGDRDVEEALETAYYALGNPVEIEVDDPDPETVANEVYARMQGSRSDPQLLYRGGLIRSLSVGDVVFVDGTALMVEDFGFEILEDVSIDAVRDGDQDDRRDDQEAATDGGFVTESADAEWCPECQRRRISCAHQ